MRKIDIVVPDNDLKYSNVQKCMYMLIHKETSKIYIGSTGDLYDRVARHSTLLLKNEHPNKNLQECFNSSNEFNLEFKIIEDKKERINEEQKFIDKYKDTDKLLNIVLDAEISARGRKLSEGHKQAILKSTTGRIKSEEEVKKISIGNKGKKRSDETKQKLREFHTGKKHTDISKEKIRQSSTGRFPSEEIRRKLQLNSVRNVPVEIDGVEYISSAEAGRILGLSNPTVYGRAISKNPKYKNYQIKRKLS